VLRATFRFLSQASVNCTASAYANLMFHMRRRLSSRRRASAFDVARPALAWSDRGRGDDTGVVDQRHS